MCSIEQVLFVGVEVQVEKEAQLAQAITPRGLKMIFYNRLDSSMCVPPSSCSACLSLLDLLDHPHLQVFLLRSVLAKTGTHRAKFRENQTCSFKLYTWGAAAWLTVFWSLFDYLDVPGDNADSKEKKKQSFCFVNLKVRGVVAAGLRRSRITS